MASRRTNLGLLVLLAWALATGTLAFAIGMGWERWVVVGHGAGGLGLLLLTPWKSVIVRRSLRRGRPGTWPSLAFGALIVAALAAGVLHATGLLRAFGPVSAMQVHVAAAIASIPFALWHVAARPVRPRRTDVSRRALLRSGAVAAGSLAAFGGLAGLTRLADLPGRRARFTGSYRVSPREIPVTQWLTDPVPGIDASAWRLSVRLHGRPVRTLSLQELESNLETVRAVIDCTGGWFAEGTWQAVRVDRLLAGADIDGGRSIGVLSATGYTRRFPVGDGPCLWLATRSGGAALAAGHGAPARIVAPGRRGFWWVKWVVALDVSDTPWWWQPPFPLQ